jgi:hypothetical protein
VIGVEAEDAAGMTESLRAGHVVTLEHVGLFADGAAVRVVGKETFRLCKDLVDGMVSSDTLAHDVWVGHSCEGKGGAIQWHDEAGVCAGAGDGVDGRDLCGHQGGLPGHQERA